MHGRSPDQPHFPHAVDLQLMGFGNGLSREMINPDVLDLLAELRQRFGNASPEAPDRGELASPSISLVVDVGMQIDSVTTDVNTLGAALPQAFDNARIIEAFKQSLETFRHAYPKSISYLLLKILESPLSADVLAASDNLEERLDAFAQGVLDLTVQHLGPDPYAFPAEQLASLGEHLRSFKTTLLELFSRARTLHNNVMQAFEIIDPAFTESAVITPQDTELLGNLLLFFSLIGCQDDYAKLSPMFDRWNRGKTISPVVGRPKFLQFVTEAHTSGRPRGDIVDGIG